MFGEHSFEKEWSGKTFCEAGIRDLRKADQGKRNVVSHSGWKGKSVHQSQEGSLLPYYITIVSAYKEKHATLSKRKEGRYLYAGNDIFETCYCGFLLEHPSDMNDGQGSLELLTQGMQEKESNPCLASDCQMALPTEKRIFGILGALTFIIANVITGFLSKYEEESAQSVNRGPAYRKE